MELLRQGLTAKRLLDRVLAEDPFEQKEGRLVAVIDGKGNVGVYTGAAANEWKGHIESSKKPLTLADKLVAAAGTAHTAFIKGSLRM